MKRFVLFATLLASTLWGGICAANSAYRLVLTFPDSSVEVCSYTQLAYYADGSIDMSVTSCNSDEIFKGDFESTIPVPETHK